MVIKPENVHIKVKLDLLRVEGRDKHVLLAFSHVLGPVGHTTQDLEA